jgi:hypothetical protein
MHVQYTDQLTCITVSVCFHVIFSFLGLDLIFETKCGICLSESAYIKEI